LKKPNRKKNRLEFLKNQPVQFGFISLKPKNQTEPKQKKLNQTRTEKIKKNQAKPKKPI